MAEQSSTRRVASKAVAEQAVRQQIVSDYTASVEALLKARSDHTSCVEHAPGDFGCTQIADNLESVQAVNDSLRRLLSGESKITKQKADENHKALQTAQRLQRSNKWILNKVIEEWEANCDRIAQYQTRTCGSD